MATRAAQNRYQSWQAAGQPFALIRPLVDLRNVLVAHGYTVYGIGNQDHLLSDPAEDHTPYSQTGWPHPASWGRGYALDIMPPAPGQKSQITGKPLPSLQALGAQLVRDRKAGVAGISHLKYINWETERNNGGPCYQDSWMPNHARRTSGDRGHIHISSRTDMNDSTIGAGYDPVARIHGGTVMDLNTKVGDDEFPNRTWGDQLRDWFKLRRWLITPIGTKGMTFVPGKNTPLAQLEQIPLLVEMIATQSTTIKAQAVLLGEILERLPAPPPPGK